MNVFFEHILKMGEKGDMIVVEDEENKLSADMEISVNGEPRVVREVRPFGNRGDFGKSPYCEVFLK
jgi:hypothetical protein